MSPSAAELDGVLIWTSKHAPSPLARAIAGVASRNGDISIAGLRNRMIDKERCCGSYTQAEINRVFVADRALIVDPVFRFEEQVLQALMHLQRHPIEGDPEGAFASNIRSQVSRQFNQRISMGAVTIAALICGYVIDPTFTEAERHLDGEAFFEAPELRSPVAELYDRGRD